jgi:hypothetical protein
MLRRGARLKSGFVYSVVPECRPLTLVVRESRELPDRWRETKNKVRVCGDELVTLAPDPATTLKVSLTRLD